MATEFEGIALLSRVRDIADILGPLGLIPGAMFFVKDVDYRYVVMSDDVRAGIGLTAGDDPIGRTDYDFFPPLIAESYRRNDRQVIDEGRILRDEVHVVVSRTGRSFLAYSSKWPLRQHDGRIIGLIGINRRHALDGDARDGAGPGRLMPAIQRMLRDFGTRLPIATLARECGLSTSHFMRLFRRTMQVTPRAFLEKVRLSQATELLCSTAEPIAAIAARCGFYDHSAFVKRFQRYAGVTPFAYRKSRRVVAADFAAAVIGAKLDGRRRGRSCGAGAGTESHAAAAPPT